MTDNNIPNQSADDEIDLRELFAVIWDGKWIIIITTFVFAVAGVFYALSLPNIYKSDVLLAPVAEDSGLNIPGQLGGLAALAGVNLGGGGEKTGLALEILKSREFIGRFINKYELTVPIMASYGWDRVDDRLLIDPDIYNSETQQWVREFKPPFKAKPSLLETHEEFMKLFTVSQDKTSDMVKLSVSHFSPYLAEQWASLLVDEINYEMRNRELKEAQDSIAYLNEQLTETKNADARTMLFSLIEEQSKTVMLANVRDEYIFKTVDAAVVSEKKAKPARVLICISATLLGGMLAILFVVIRSLISRNDASRRVI